MQNSNLAEQSLVIVMGTQMEESGCLVCMHMGVSSKGSLRHSASVVMPRGPLKSQGGFTVWRALSWLTLQVLIMRWIVSEKREPQLKN